jgi:hypothetical protein
LHRILKPFEELSPGGKKARLHPEYYRAYQRKNRGIINKRNRKHYADNLEEERQYWRTYLANNPEIRKKRHMNHKNSTKLQAMQRVSGLEVPECVNCGCTDLRMLTVNHKNLGGTAERRENNTIGSHAFYHSIIIGERSTEDLDIRCGVCNIIHYYALKYGAIYSQLRFIGTRLSSAREDIIKMGSTEIQAVVIHPSKMRLRRILE